MLKIISFKFAILNVNIKRNVEPNIIAAETKSAKSCHFNSKLYTKKPKSDENILIASIVKMVFKKSKVTSFRFFNITKLSVEDVSDIKTYPIINENVPIYFGRKNMHKISTAEDRP